jgi:hypothetical protein
MTKEQIEKNKEKEKLSSYYKCYFCEKCGHVELPESISGKLVEKLESCPECGEENKFQKRVGRFAYEEERKSFSFFRKRKTNYFLKKFIPGLDPKDQKKRDKKNR